MASIGSAQRPGRALRWTWTAAFDEDDPGAREAEDERPERLGARTADIAGRAFKGDPTGIHEALGGRLGLEQIRQQEADLMRNREARFGSYRGHAVVGSVPYGEGRVETGVRVDLEKGEGGATVLVIPGPDGPVRLPRVP